MNQKQICIIKKDIIFKNLGLLIIDEEQKFGVKHKEVIKQKNNNVEIISLTATPIPRTLSLSLGGLKDISIIATPPVDRAPIKTFNIEWDDVSRVNVLDVMPSTRSTLGAPAEC